MTELDTLKIRRRKLEHELEPLLLLSDLSRAQSAEFESKMTESEKVIEKIRTIESKTLNNRNMATNNELNKFNFGKFVREATNGTLTGFEAEVHEEGKSELLSISGESARGFCISERILNSASFRANTGQNVGTLADGGNMVQNEPIRYYDALQNALILPSMGATFLNGLVGYVPIVKGGLFTAQWVPEGSAPSYSKEAFDRVLMQPKRVVAMGAFSKQLLVQTSPAIDSMILRALIMANAEAMQTAIINGLAANNQPVGILNNSNVTVVPGGDNGLMPTFRNLIDLESAVASNNADVGTLGYLTNAKVRGLLKGTLKAANVSGYIWENDQLNGYKAAVTNSVPGNLTKGTANAICSAIIFGNWRDLLIGSWGGLDIVIDPFTLSAQSEIRMIVNSFVDAQLVNEKSFAVMTDALTA